MIKLLIPFYYLVNAMKQLLKPLLLFSLCLSCGTTGWCTYKVSGKVNLGEEWQPKVFMAMMEKLSDYYRASPDLIVDIAIVQKDGSFVLEGKQLPEENRFYRLYLMKEQNTDYDACLYVGGDDHNFVHLILNNHSELEIIADSTYYSPFGNYQVRGDKGNVLMRQLARMVYPSFYFYQIRFPTELKLSEEKLFNDLKLFADTCGNDMAALAAMANIDMEATYELDSAFFKAFGQRLETSMPDDVYTKNYLRRLYYFDSPLIPYIPFWIWGIITSQLVIISILAFSLLKRTRSNTAHSLEPQSPISAPMLAEKLTSKEQEIFDLILAGKSNKEIASALFIEVSTVKTHINKIYGKLNVKSRKEAIQLKQLPTT